MKVLARWVSLATALCALDSHAALRVAVLYFENHTGLRDYDVLQKGMADMLISDLSVSDQLALVERNRLEVVMAEQKLQKSKQFDPATAVKVGKLLGASYAITGAFSALDPDVRIDVRMIDIQSSNVVVTAQVKGKKEAFFELEQQLVKKFFDALEAKGTATAGQLSLDHALSYSKGLDSADQGDLKGASTKLATVVRDAPEFPHAKTRYAELLKKLREAGKRRDEALGADETALLDGFQKAFEAGTGKVLKGNQLEVYFCYRAMKTAYLLWKLEQPLGAPQGPLQMKVADKATAKKLLQEIWDNEVQLMNDAIANHGSLQYSNHALSCPMALAREKLDDFYRLKTLRVPWYHMPRVHPADRIPDLVVFASTGRFSRAQFKEDEDEIPRLSVAPTLVALEPSMAKKSLALLDAAQKHLALPLSRSVSDANLSIEAARATLLVNAGRREEGIAALQSWLDKNPKARAYKAVEAQAETLMGVSEQGKADQAAMSQCKAADEVIVRAIDGLFDSDGAAEVEKTLGALEKKCAQQSPKSYSVAAWSAVLRGDCKMAAKFAQKGDDVAAVRALCD